MGGKKMTKTISLNKIKNIDLSQHMGKVFVVVTVGRRVNQASWYFGVSSR